MTCKSDKQIVDEIPPGFSVPVAISSMDEHCLLDASGYPMLRFGNHFMWKQQRDWVIKVLNEAIEKSK